MSAYLEGLLVWFWPDGDGKSAYVLVALRGIEIVGVYGCLGSPHTQDSIKPVAESCENRYKREHSCMADII